jgi:hypothetical protein
MSRNKSLVLVLGGAMLLGGCTDMYLDRRDTVSFGAGDAVAVNKVAHMVDPWPIYAGNRNIPHDGERMAAAAERYRTDKVKSLSTSSTSSVSYVPVMAPMSK